MIREKGDQLSKLGNSQRTSPATSTMQDLIVIEAGRRERHHWLDLWRYRELLRVLASHDLAVRYKQTVIGLLRRLIVWALLAYQYDDSKIL